MHGLIHSGADFLGKRGFSGGRQGCRRRNAVQAGSWIGAWIGFFGDARFLVNRSTARFDSVSAVARRLFFRTLSACAKQVVRFTTKSLYTE
jgi:hypothetical protein